MKWFGSDKKKARSTVAREAAPPKLDGDTPCAQPTTESESDIVIYGLNGDRRSQALRDLLKEAGFAFREELIDEDLSTRAWLQRSTGDDALPKLFVGAQCHGTYEDIQALAFRGELKRVL